MNIYLIIFILTSLSLNAQVGIGTDKPEATLHVAGTGIITCSKGIPSAIMGRDETGNISDLSLGKGLKLSDDGELTSDSKTIIVEISNVNFPFRNVQTHNGNTLKSEDITDTDFTIWDSAVNTDDKCDIILPEPSTVDGRTLNLIAADNYNPFKVCSKNIDDTIKVEDVLTYANSSRISRIPKGRRATIQATHHFGGMWTIVSTDILDYNSSLTVANVE